MISPRDAITKGQVWLRPFGHFCPGDQGYMGFSSSERRDRFYNSMVNGALVLIWTKTKHGEPGWVGKFRGILQLEKRKLLAHECSTTVGEQLRTNSDRDFNYAIQAVRGWEACPDTKIEMKAIVPSIWPNKTQSIGTHSVLMDRSEISNIENISVREINVAGQPVISPDRFEMIRLKFR